MKCCDICGRKIKQGENILEFKNKTYCIDCRKQYESQGNAPWKNYRPLSASWIWVIVILLVLLIGGLIAYFFWWRKLFRK